MDIYTWLIIISVTYFTSNNNIFYESERNKFQILATNVQELN